MEVRALLAHRRQPRELVDVHGLRAPAERHQVQPVAAEPRADKVVERERRPLHRHPPALGRHRVRDIDEQHDGRLGTGLGLGHLDIAHVQAQRPRVAALEDRTRHGVGHGPRHVPGLGVAERPLAAGAGLFARRTGHPGVARARTAGQLLRCIRQQRLPELSHRCGRELQRPVGRTPQQPRLAHLPLHVSQRPRRDHRVIAELTLQGLEVDVVEPCTSVRLSQLLAQGLELGQVLEDPGAVSEPDALIARERLGARPVLAGAQRLQVRVQLAELAHELRRAERLRREGHQLGPLVGRHRPHHPLGRGCPLRQRLDELLDGLRLLREEVPVLVHEVREVLGGVLALPVLVEELVEIGQHLRDGRAVLVARVLERVLHAGEPLVEQLAPQEVLDLLVRLLGGLGLPVVRTQRVHGSGRRAGERVERHLPQGPVAVVHGRVAGELLALFQERRLEQLLDLLERAVELVVAQQALSLPVDVTGQVVEAALVAAAAPQVLAQRALRRVPRHDVLRDRLQRLGEVDRRRERIGSARIPSVLRPTPVRTSHTGSRRRRCPWRCGGRGTGPRVRARWRWPARPRWWRRIVLPPRRTRRSGTAVPRAVRAR